MLLRIVKSILFVYKSIISPAVHLWAGPGYGCKFRPTCSDYAAEAFSVHGVRKGGLLTLRRILKCHPFCSGSDDPVPKR